MNNKFFLVIVGTLSIIGGMLAFFNPLEATLTAEQFIALLFLSIGSLQLVSAWQYRTSSLMKWLTIGGILTLVIGGFLLFHPEKGAMALTAIIGTALLTGGVIRLCFALVWRGNPIFFPMVLSGVLSLILSILIFADFPRSAETILGLFLAIELVSNGVTMLFLSHHD